LQFNLRSLFHLCTLAAAMALCGEGVFSGRVEKVVLPLFGLGIFYTGIIAVRLRKTIARFAWYLAIFCLCWTFLIAYVASLISYLHTLQASSGFARVGALDVIAKGFSWAFAPLAIWAGYGVVRTYERAKFELNQFQAP
jgi:hypothetical protein